MLDTGYWILDKTADAGCWIKLPMLDTGSNCRCWMLDKAADVGYWIKQPMLDAGYWILDKIADAGYWIDFIQNPVSLFVFIQHQASSIQSPVSSIISERWYNSCSIRIVVRLLLSEELAIRPNKIGEIILRHFGIFLTFGTDSI